MLENGNISNGHLPKKSSKPAEYGDWTAQIVLNKHSNANMHDDVKSSGRIDKYKLPNKGSQDWFLKTQNYTEKGS